MNDNSFTHLFYINTKYGQKKYFNSSTEMIIFEDNVYLPYSGLSLEFGEFDDSGHNKIILHGIYEYQGISINSNLVGSMIKIMIYENDCAEEIVTYICTEQISENLEFKLICQPESIKLNKPLLPVFSKKCRANFCDSACGLDIEKFQIVTEISTKDDNLLFCKNIGNIDKGYFINGNIIIEYYDGSVIERRIKNNYANKIELIDGNFTIENIMKIYLTPSCDKNIRTCCYSFNNTVNFRGEPDIPEHKIIKN